MKYLKEWKLLYHCDNNSSKNWTTSSKPDLLNCLVIRYIIGISFQLRNYENLER